LTAIAALLRPSQVEPLTQKVEKCRAGIAECDRALLTIDGEADGE
jgi:hypothetical protein